MVRLHGCQLIGDSHSSEGSTKFRAINPATQRELDTAFHEATLGEIDRALGLAAESFDALAASGPTTRASLLDGIADGLEHAGEALTERCHAETALPLGRLHAERTRTVGQTRLIAAMLREGSWVDARIDHGDPNRKPLPKPDIRSMLTGIGPVVVFGASNFPIAISVAGTDTTTALAAGCPVVVKAHAAHPGACELIGQVVREAVVESGLPAGVFSMLQGQGHEVGRALVEHPATAAVAFTGSLAGGRALFDAAARRPKPIPVYAEMGSINPVFVLPGALAEHAKAIAQGYVASVTLGVGQFCTCPGLLLVPKGGATKAFLRAVREAAERTAPDTMLHSGIRAGYNDGVGRLRQMEGVQLLATSNVPAVNTRTEAACMIFVTDQAVLKREVDLTREIFGPCGVIVRCDDSAQMTDVARQLDGQLTATLHATQADLRDHAELIAVLRRKAGRLVLNGFPTGVEVCHAIHHGGPYPATTDAHFTSIGPVSIKRFTRPICFQDFPNAALPEELQDGNPRGIMRLVNGAYTR